MVLPWDSFNKRASNILVKYFLVHFASKPFPKLEGAFFVFGSS
jgi:hypothetical protein